MGQMGVACVDVVVNSVCLLIFVTLFCENVMELCD